MKTHTGFTLIEVLIAMLVLAVGLLGLAGLQTATLRNNLVAYNHGQATQLLYDMADRMRANNCEVTSTVTCSFPVNYVVTDTNAYSGTLNTNCKTVTGCNPTVLASNDIIEWNTAIAGTLPKGKGAITISAVDPSVFILSVTWDEDRSGTVTADDPTFTMNVQPWGTP